MPTGSSFCGGTAAESGSGSSAASRKERIRSRGGTACMSWPTLADICVTSVEKEATALQASTKSPTESAPVAAWYRNHR